MERKITTGTSTIAFIEIGLGVIGSVLFLIMAIFYINSLLYKNSAGMFTDLPLIGMSILWPYVLLLIAGIGVLKLKLWAWYMNICIIPSIFIIVYGYFFFYWHGGFNFIPIPIRDWHWYVFFLIFIFLFSVVQIWFYARTTIKEQFKK